jgi:hypothetical protein
MNGLWACLLVLIVSYGGLQWSWWLLSFFEFHGVPDILADGFPLGVAVIVVIPAKNEIGCIQDTVTRWRDQVQVSGVMVLDDDSTDGSADAAWAGGAYVVTNAGKWKGGKAGAMEWWSRECDHSESVVYVFSDADNIPDPAHRCTAARLALVAHRHGIAQCQVRGKPGNFLQDVLGVERASAWAVLESGRCRMGASAYLAGSGWAATGLLFSTIKFPTFSVCDDLAYSFRVAALGLRVPYVEQVVVLEGHPASLRVLWRQRVRWARGTFQCIFDRSILGAMRGTEWWMGWFMVIGQMMMLVFMGSVLASMMVTPERFVGMLTSVWLLSMMFCVSGALRTRRWRGILGYMFLWGLNLMACGVGLLSWHSMNWVPTIHKG